jgi:hypothetical protein
MDGDGFSPERIRSTGVFIGPAACASSRRAFASGTEESNMTDVTLDHPLAALVAF